MTVNGRVLPMVALLKTKLQITNKMTTKNETTKNNFNATSHKTDVISRFLYEMATKHNISVDDIIIGIEEIHPRRDDGKIKLQVMNLDFELLEEFLSENGL